MSEIVADIKKYAEERKSIESHILKYIESEDDDDKNYQDMTESLSNYKNPDKKEEFKYLLNSLGVISNHHYHSPNFYTKIERIIFFFQEEIKQTFSKDDLFNLFDYNKRILLFFLENGFISMDQEIAEKIFSEKYKKFHYVGYFSPEIEKWKENDRENNVISIEQQVMACKAHKMKYIYGKKKKPIAEFDYITEKIDLDSKSEEFRKSGNFESRICELIRNDSIDDFIIYLNQNDIKPTEKVERSIFELNYLLNEREISLIEYACFYGSIKIFQYLQINGAELTSFLWDCAIYSNNAEMIQKLEELNVPLDSQEQCVIESIKCHNFDIFDYFSDKANMDTLIESCFKYYNFTCLNDVNFYENKSSFAYACEYVYPLLVKLFIKIGNTTINQPEINEKHIFFIFFFILLL